MSSTPRPRPSTPGPRIAVGDRVYDWIDVPVDDESETAWAHTGVAAGPDGSVYCADASGHGLLAFAPDGTVRRTDLPVTECHGLAPHTAGGVWVADHGHKFVPEGKGYGDELTPGAVGLYTPEGKPALTLDAPQGQQWRPSGVALHDFGRGSEGRLWVADGYGRSLVHCFSAGGSLLWTTDGATSGRPFDTPHGIVVDTRPEVPVLRVADRSNRRIVTLSLDGEVLDVFGEGLLTSPSGFAVDGDRLWVTELFGSLVVFDADNRPAGSLGTPVDEPDQPEGWPNAVVDGRTVAPPLTPGAFRSPHGIAAAPDGGIWVSEWCTGGRLTRLRPAG